MGESPRWLDRDNRHAQPVQQGELEGHESARRHASPHVARCGLPGRQLHLLRPHKTFVIFEQWKSTAG